MSRVQKSQNQTKVQTKVQQVKTIKEENGLNREELEVLK